MINDDVRNLNYLFFSDMNNSY